MDDMILALLSIVVVWVLAAVATIILFHRWAHRQDDHQLAEPRRHPSGYYHARCECGVMVHGMTLPDVWNAHDEHLEHVRSLPW